MNREGGNCPGGLEILPAPFDVKLADDTVVQPDIAVVRSVDFSPRYLSRAPLLAIEILSPSTQLYDRQLKRARYEASGLPAYWLIALSDLRRT